MTPAMTFGTSRFLTHRFHIPGLQLKGTMSPVLKGGLPVITLGVAVVSAYTTLVVTSSQPRVQPTNLSPEAVQPRLEQEVSVAPVSPISWGGGGG